MSQILYYTHQKETGPIEQLVAPHVKASGLELVRVHTVPGLLEGQVCLVLGKGAVDELKKDAVLPKNRGIASFRQHPVKYYDGHLFITYDPAIVYVDWERKHEIEWDVRLACRYVKTGKLTPEFGAGYKFSYGMHDLLQDIQDRYTELQDRVPISLDLETYGLDPFREDRWIVSITFTTAPGNAYVIPLSEHSQPHPDSLDPKKQSLWHELRDLLSSSLVKVWGANLKYDLVWILQKWSIPCTNYVMDTTLVGSLLDENRSNSLTAHAQVYTSMGGYDHEFNLKYDKGNMPAVLEKHPEDFMLYAGGDTDATYRVAKVQRKELLKDKRLTRFYTKLLHPASEAFVAMEHRGIVVDEDRYLELKSEVEIHIDKLEKQIIGMFSGRLKAWHRKGGLSLTRSSLISDYLFSKHGLGLTPKLHTGKTGAPSTAGQHLMMFENHPEAGPFIKLYKEYTATKKTHSTYIVGFLKHLREDGRFHPSYILHRGGYEGGSGGSAGTVTGRTAAKDPAFQTLPKHTIWTKMLREVYVPPPGYVILAADFSQGELRVTACVAREPEMIKAYQKGYDMHAVTAAVLNGMTYETFIQQDAEWQAAQRFGGKAGNFGLIYGMQAGGFREYTRVTFGVEWSLQQATEYRDAFFARYKGLVKWHEDCIKAARKFKQIRSPIGRIRHLPLIHSNNNEVRAQAERQAINSGIQSTLSDMTLYAMALLHRAYPGLWIWSMTHDSLTFYIPEDKVDEWVVRIQEIMGNLPLHELGWNPQLAFPVDMEIGAENYSKLTKVQA